MPIYEYTCKACGEAFEQLIRTQQDERSLACPKCSGRKVERRPSVFAAHGSAAPAPLPRGGGCGRCGDPNGPCSVG